ncbi:helix-turn-helix transcriptional regulator [Jeongeupia sp. USM3]|uniref:ArsR/SmtB family transcription factor n=1 Tax=Jeongeupia sp. USM3 TaxID=1906741 RepID=UPI0009F1C647|nr:metalloregulator ArsR/SmtB family transcription factor [Jeongeupia sp. USM3]
MNASPPELAQMRSAAGAAVDLLKTLANQDRLLLLCRMSQGERNVGQLEADLDIHQPTLSQQLGVLRRAGLVATRKDGKQVYYSLANAAAIAVIGTLYQQFCDNGEAQS